MLAQLVSSRALAAGLAVAAGAALLRRWRQRESVSGACHVCECGAVLSGLSDHNVLKHRRSVRHARNMEMVGRSRLVICENWSEYRRMIGSCVEASDAVLELGCGRGVTTEKIARAGCKRVVGIDRSHTVIAMARERFPQLEFRALDAMALAAIRAIDEFDVIFVDINGSRELQTLLPVLEAYIQVLKPRTIVVKNVRLKRLLLSSVLAE
mmetsp:Transcript_40792/g.135893  ORF Transcript_40792/g.135893 Transcript_40792/m.135893 type:complete len:210 (-) Transcript_40792:236-865(-)